MAERGTSPPTQSLQLTFEYEGRTVRLASRQSVAMIPPPPEPAPIQGERHGFWVELKDAAGKTLYQRAVQQPIRFEVEVFPEDHRRAIQRVPRSDPRGAFALVVPDLPEAATVIL